MKRLTDRKIAAELKANADGLRAAGIEPTISDQRYIKLAEYEDAEELIKPTTDAEPVKHGRWDGYLCSVCNEHAGYFISGDFWIDEKPNFCPNCGAKMDGD